MFDDADTDKKGYISEKSAVRLIKSINSRLLTNRVKQKVKVFEKLFNGIINEGVGAQRYGPQRSTARKNRPDAIR